MNRGFSWRRILLVLFVVGLAGIFISAFGLRAYAGRGLRTLEGTYSHPDLRGEVEVIRDDWGVPHIQADNAHDAYFALGFSVAQDRTFQLEILRRLGRGELSEILGEAALPTDKVSRTLLWRRTAERLWSDTSVYDPEFVTVIEAFVKGINFALDIQPTPLEFTLLGIEPQPFTPVDCLSMMGYMSYGFAEGLKADSLYSLVASKHPDRVRELFPGYAGQKPVTVMEGNVDEAIPPIAARPADGDRRTHNGLEQLAQLADATLDLLPGFEGSNSWVIAPERSKSGGAILANDPHIGFSNPAVWYECHIRYGDFESYGVHLPLIPFAMIAHNRDKAWAMTMFENDDLDLYRESFDPGDDSLVQYKGEWTRVDRWIETIAVKGQEPVDLTITTTPHGPIVTDMLKGYEGDPVSAWWVFLQITPGSVQAFYELGKASNMDEARAAASKIEAPGLNISYADRHGNIAWWGAAKIPVRPSHVNAKTILDGASGRDEPVDWLPFEQNPQMENPPAGVIVTSNNMSTVKPVGPIAALEGYWQPSDRAGRLHDLFAAQDTWSLEELKAVQTDALLRSGAELASIIISGMAGEPDLSNTERDALDALRAWDGDCGIESVGATVYHFAYAGVRRALLADEIGEELLSTYGSIADSDNVMQSALRNLDSVLWDDVNTETLESAAEIIRAGFRNGVADLVERHGPSPAGWQWGQAHTVEYKHIIGNVKPMDRLFNIGPYPAPGTWESVAKMSWRNDPYRVEHGASMRLLLDYAQYGTAEGMWMVLPTGNSGHFLSPHFRNQAEMYLAGDYRSIRLSDADIDASREHTVVLKPETTD